MIARIPAKLARLGANVSKVITRLVKKLDFTTTLKNIISTIYDKLHNFLFSKKAGKIGDKVPSRVPNAPNTPSSAPNAPDGPDAPNPSSAPNDSPPAAAGGSPNDGDSPPSKPKDTDPPNEKPTGQDSGDADKPSTSDTADGDVAPKSGTLSNVEARKWYLEQESKILGEIDPKLPLRDRAVQAFNRRNELRTQARELMSDRELAEKLMREEPNMTLRDLVKRKYQQKGLVGDELWQDILDSSQKSRSSVNKKLGLE